MDIAEFVKERDRMCSCYYDKRAGACSCSCPSISINCRSFDTEEVNKLIPIVEKWSKDYPNKTNSKIYSEDYKNTVDKTGIPPKQKTIINVDPEIEGIVKRYVLECVQVLKGEVCKAVSGNESATEKPKIGNFKREDKAMFTVKAKPEHIDSYKSCFVNADNVMVYDVKIDDRGDTYFLTYNMFWGKWKLEPANRFQPTE